MKRYTYTVGEVVAMLLECDVIGNLNCTVDVQAGRGFQVTIEPSGYTAPELLPHWSDSHRDFELEFRGIIRE